MLVDRCCWMFRRHSRTDTFLGHGYVLIIVVVSGPLLLVGRCSWWIVVVGWFVIVGGSLWLVDHGSWWIVVVGGSLLLIVFKQPDDVHTPTPSWVCFDNFCYVVDCRWWIVVVFCESLLFSVNHCCWWIVVVGGSLLFMNRLQATRWRSNTNTFLGLPTDWTLNHNAMCKMQQPRFWTQCFLPFNSFHWQGGFSLYMLFRWKERKSRRRFWGADLLRINCANSALER